MQIFVKKVADGRVLTVEVEGHFTVGQLKDLIQEQDGVKPDRQRLLFDQVDLVGERTLADYRLHKEAELMLVVRPERPFSDEQGRMFEEIARLGGMNNSLQRRWRQLSRSRSALDEAKKALEQANSGGKLKKKLKINVGGTLFKTVKRETLLLVPESHLAELFSGRWETQILRDQKGNMFLDVNPECFGKILTFLSERTRAAPDAPIGTSLAVLGLLQERLNAHVARVSCRAAWCAGGARTHPPSLAGLLRAGGPFRERGRGAARGGARARARGGRGAGAGAGGRRAAPGGREGAGGGRGRGG